MSKGRFRRQESRSASVRKAERHPTAAPQRNVSRAYIISYRRRRIRETRREGEAMVRRRELIGYALLAIISWPFALWGADTESQRPKTPIAHLEVAAGHVEWLPQVEYERLILTVAGPGGFFVRQELKPGKTPSLNVLDAKGGHLPDGSYAYEL